MTESVTIMNVIPLFFNTTLYDPLRVYRPHHGFGGHLDSRQPHVKLQFSYGNLMLNDFCKTAVNSENISTVNLSLTSKDCRTNFWCCTCA